MSWIQALYNTYEKFSGKEEFIVEDTALLPICHVIQNIQIEVVLDRNGNLIPNRSRVITDKDEQKTIIPVTEDSAGRSGSKPVCHPLCDKLQYLAGDFTQYTNNVTTGYRSSPNKPFEMYYNLLSKWVNSKYSHSKIISIHKYVSKKQLMKDLISEGILFLNQNGSLLESWKDPNLSKPDIFKIMLKDQLTSSVLVRWKVEEIGVNCSGTWEDRELWKSWYEYDLSQKEFKDLCMIKGEKLSIAKNHPKRIRHGADNAKLISGNDNDGFTFRGRFLDSLQSCSVSFEVTQKIHTTLRWLISRQGFRNGTQTIVSWANNLTEIPSPLENTNDFFNFKLFDNDQDDIGQAFAKRLNSKLSGYKKDLGSTNSIILLALDSASPGRMAISFYRELTGDYFFKNLEKWHLNYSWWKRCNNTTVISAPSPKDIADLIYPRPSEERAKRSIVERILTCIIDGKNIPRDILSCIQSKSINRSSFEDWQWNKYIEIACSVYKGYHSNQRNYKMTLEESRSSRDYLYGRLLALAEHLELSSLRVAGESRETSVTRLMARFVNHPYSTWGTIHLGLRPYISRLKAKQPRTLVYIDKIIDEVMCLFLHSDFCNDSKLSGEFLLGYHCQRSILWSSKEPEKLDDTTITN
jgi:CRISPR-associated protein Csd1